MNDTERIIGELTEFKRATVVHLQEIKADVKALQKSKWIFDGKVGAATFGLSMILTVLAEGLHIYWRR